MALEARILTIPVRLNQSNTWQSSGCFFFFLCLRSHSQCNLATSAGHVHGFHGHRRRAPRHQHRHQCGGPHPHGAPQCWPLLLKDWSRLDCVQLRATADTAEIVVMTVCCPPAGSVRAHCSATTPITIAAVSLRGEVPPQSRLTSLNMHCPPAGAGPHAGRPRHASG